MDGDITVHYEQRISPILEGDLQNSDILLIARYLEREREKHAYACKISNDSKIESDWDVGTIRIFLTETKKSIINMLRFWFQKEELENSLGSQT